MRQRNHEIAMAKRRESELELKRLEIQRQRKHAIFVKKYKRVMKKTRCRSAVKIQQCWKEYKDKK